MTEPIAERVTRVETENESCAAQRLEFDTRLNQIERVLNQTAGALRIITIFAGLLTGGAGLALAKALISHL